MEYTIFAHGVTLSAQHKEQIRDKTARLEKYLKHPFPVEVTFRREPKGALIICILMYGEGKHVLRAERTGHSVEESLDLALGALKRELIKQRDKKQSRN